MRKFEIFLIEFLDNPFFLTIFLGMIYAFSLLKNLPIDCFFLNKIVFLEVFEFKQIIGP